LPILACLATVVGSSSLSHTLVGRAFLAIAEDNFAARALGLPERNLRMASYALAGVIGGLAGFASGQLLLAFFANGALLNFYGFVPVALGGLGNNRGAIISGLVLGVFQQAANFTFGGVFASVAVFAVFIVVLWPRRKDCSARRRSGGYEWSPRMSEAAGQAVPAQRGGAGETLRRVLPFAAIFGAGLILPAVSNDYWTLIATRAAIYWILVSA
jgi:hypothetical protein